MIFREQHVVMYDFTTVGLPCMQARVLAFTCKLPAWLKRFLDVIEEMFTKSYSNFQLQHF